MKTDSRLITPGEDFCHASLEGQIHGGCLLQATKEVFEIICPFRSNYKQKQSKWSNLLLLSPKTLNSARGR